MKKPKNDHSGELRLPVLKTYKLFIGGGFPRSESGRFFTPVSKAGDPIANVCRASRKDLRDAVTSAYKAQPGWEGRSAFLRGQILYRIAEMMEGKRAQFLDELEVLNPGKGNQKAEFSRAVDLVVHYAGWCDKYQQIFSTVNPVASPHFNFSIPGPSGVIGIIAPAKFPLLGLVSLVVPVIAGGNSCVVLASETNPLPAVTLGEVLATADVPGGVVNILTGFAEELLPYFSTHMEINGISFSGLKPAQVEEVSTGAALNIKRVADYNALDFSSKSSQSPYMILDFQEIKTTWHPIGV